MRDRSDTDVAAGAWSGRAGFFARALLVAFALAGFAYSCTLGSAARFPDETDYLAIADSLARSGTYSADGVVPSAMRPPGYPLLLAPVAGAARAVAGIVEGGTADAGAVDATAHTIAVHAIRTLQFLALGLSAFMLASLAGPPDATPKARLAGGEPAGPSRGTLGCLMLAGLVGYPVLVYTAGTLFPQTALLALATLVIWLLERARPGIGSAAAIGFICGGIAEVSPTALTLVPLAALHAALSPRWRARHVVVVCLAAALLPGAWLVRNHLVLDETILFSKNLAYNLDNAVLELRPLAPDEVREPDDVFGYGAERLGQLFTAPGAYLARFREHFAWRNKLYVADESSGTRDLVMLATYGALLALVLLRLALMRYRRLSRAERSVLALYLMTAAFHALVFVRIRYRLPFDFLLLLPASNALLLVSGLLSRRRGDEPARREATTTLP